MTQIGHDGLNAMLVGFPTKAAEAVCTFAYSAGPGIQYLPYILKVNATDNIFQGQNQFYSKVRLKEPLFQREDPRSLAGMLFSNLLGLD